MDQRPRVTLPLDAWAQAVLFLGAKDAVRTRLVSHAMGGAFDRACWGGPAQAATLPGKGEVAIVSWVYRVAKRVVHHCTCSVPPLWLRYIRRDVLMAVLARCGCNEACVGLASSPFLFGPEDARSHDNLALRMAAENGHVAVVDRLAEPPFSLGPDDARSWDNCALVVAAHNGHIAVLDRLAIPPYSLGTEDARTGGNSALRRAAETGNVALLDRLAAPPYSLGPEDARTSDLTGAFPALRWAAFFGHVAVLDRLAAPPYSLGQDAARSSDNQALRWAAQNGHAAVLDRLAAPPYATRYWTG